MQSQRQVIPGQQRVSHLTFGSACVEMRSPLTAAISRLTYCNFSSLAVRGDSTLLPCRNVYVHNPSGYVGPEIRGAGVDGGLDARVLGGGAATRTDQLRNPVHGHDGGAAGNRPGLGSVRANNLWLPAPRPAPAPAAPPWSTPATWTSPPRSTTPHTRTPAP